MNFRQKWNKELQLIADKFFTKLDKSFGISYSEESLDGEVIELFNSHEKRRDFFVFLMITMP